MNTDFLPLSIVPLEYLSKTLGRASITSFHLHALTVGKKRWERLSPDQRQARRSCFTVSKDSARAVNLSDDKELAGGRRLRVFWVYDSKISNETLLGARSSSTGSLKNLSLNMGPMPWVRIRTDWLFEVRDNKGMSYPELAVLTAIYSKIGAREVRYEFCRMRFGNVRMDLNLIVFSEQK